MVTTPFFLEFHTPGLSAYQGVPVTFYGGRIAESIYNQPFRKFKKYAYIFETYMRHISLISLTRFDNLQITLNFVRMVEAYW